METLMRMQHSYDISRARRRENEIMVERFTVQTPVESPHRPMRS